MAFFVLHKLILQTYMCSHPVGLDVCFLVWPFVYFHSSCVRTAKSLARLCGCAGLPGPSLVTYVISTIISWAGSFIVSIQHCWSLEDQNNKPTPPRHLWNKCLCSVPPKHRTGPQLCPHSLKLQSFGYKVISLYFASYNTDIYLKNWDLFKSDGKEVYRNVPKVLDWKAWARVHL